MPIERHLPSDKDIDATIERLYRVDANTPAALLKKVKARFLEANQRMNDPARVAVGEPLVVPEIEDLPTRAQPPTASLILLRGISALQGNLAAIATQMLADMQSGKDEEAKMRDTLGKGILKKITPDDIAAAKPILDDRIKALESQIKRLSNSSGLLKRDMETFNSRFSR